MTKDVLEIGAKTISVEKASEIQYRLEVELMFLREVILRAPASLVPQLQKLIDARQGADVALATKIAVLSFDVPIEANEFVGETP